ncbi:hypothetical protein [Chryseobacterium sp. OSA05B]|uniref:hypothetical protein n=1 Tax=Chryseobacterium sp. OSA05B TaxID=2862650 RepID=UPI001CBED42A|nr:hypothetical protein [Chryseobacterium sp. OSA05B]
MIDLFFKEVLLFEMVYSQQIPSLAWLRNLLKDAVETGKNAKPVILFLPTAEGKIEKFAVYSNNVVNFYNY